MNRGIIIDINGISLLEEPNRDSKEIRKILIGNYVKILEEQPKESRESWIKIEKDSQIGWILVNPYNFKKTKSLLNDLFVSNLEGANIFESPFHKSKVIGVLPYGKKITFDAEGFQSERDGYFYNHVKVDTVQGFVQENDFTTVHYSKEEIQKAPFVGMTYLHEIPNCKTEIGTLMQIKGEPYEDNYTIDQIRCNQKLYIIFNETLRHVTNNPENYILNVIEAHKYPMGNGKGFAIDQFGPDGMICYANERILQVSYVDLKKGVPEDDNKGNIIYKNVIIKSWIFDKNTNSLIEKTFPSSKCVTLKDPID